MTDTTQASDIDNLPEYTIKRITYSNVENGWSVLKTECGQTLVGNLAQLNIGDCLKAEGVMGKNQYGEQLKVSRYFLVEPSTEKGILAFLKGGAIKGLGPKKAEAMVVRFGKDTLNVLEDVDRLSTVPGIGKKTAKQIADAWKKNRFIHQVYIFLQGHGITSNQATKIFKLYGAESIQKVKQNPFRLAYDIDGIGFMTCDKIAASMGWDKDHPERIKAGCLYYIDQLSANEGHVYVVGHEISRDFTTKLGVSLEQISTALLALVNQNVLLYENVQGEGRYYQPKLHRAEKGVADHVLRLAKGSLPEIMAKANTAIAVALEQNAIKLSDEQESSVNRILASKFSILTGGPGVGKTTVTNVIIKAFENLGLNVVLGSPTGRAAKRMTELSQRPAMTIHRLLEFDQKTGGFKRGEDYPLTGDVFILDEVSMLDVNLAHSLLKSLPSHSLVVIVGDVDQLPSVGPGMVLRDLINSDVVTTCQLTKIFRQAESSNIITSAHAINKGDMPEQLLANTAGSDAFYLPREEAEQILGTIKTIITQNLLKKGFTPDDIQVLCPMNKGDLGTVAINAMLQELLNPPSDDKPELTRGQKTYRKGDRIIQLRNNYDLGVMNGDLGKILDIDLDRRQLTADFGGTYGADPFEVTYEFSELDEIQLAYAMSIHKSQGSEYPCVIMPITTSAWVMLQRNLIYTGLTRARKFLVILGQKKALSHAVKNNPTLRRNSALVERLVHAAPRVLVNVDKAPA